MNKQIIIICIVLLSSYGCNKEKAKAVESDVELDTIEKKVSYVLGYDSASRMRTEGFTLDAKAIALAVEELNTGKESRMTEAQMQATMSAFQAQIQEQRQERINKEMAENLALGKEFLTENAQREGVTVLESGLQYEVLSPGTGVTPTLTDQVTVNYTGSLINGDVFDEGEAVSFQVNHVIPGWVEGMALMKVGAKWKLFVPSDLAYGAGGTGNIGPNSTLIFEVELLSIGGE